jgi:hypothetical protein
MPATKYPTCPVEGAKLCTRCNRIKPLAVFHREPRTRSGFTSWCKACKRASNAEASQAPHRKAAEKAHRDTDAYRAAKLACFYRRHEAALATQRQYRQTLMGRLISGRNSARGRARRAKTDAARESALALIATYDQEIARVRAKQDAD